VLRPRHAVACPLRPSQTSHRVSVRLACHAAASRPPLEPQLGVLACLASQPACLRLSPACLRLTGRPRQDAPRAKQQKGRDESPVLEVSTNGILCMRFASGEVKLVPRYVQDGRTVAMVDGQTLEVARLVAGSFHGPPPQPDWIVQHINGNTLDDSADNLLWVPPSHGGRPQPDGHTGGPRCKVVCIESDL